MSLLKEPIDDDPRAASHSQSCDREADGGDSLPRSSGELIRCVSEAIAHFAAIGISAEEMEPLFRLQEALGDTARPSREKTTEATQETKEQRRERPASEIVLGHACAIVDLFIFSGETPEKAAQSVMRQLAAAGVGLSEQGGDSRAWKRLLNYRNLLLHGSKSQRIESRKAYVELKNKLREIPAQQRIEVALKEHLWDRRDTSR